MKILHLTKEKFLITLLACVLACSSVFAAVSSTKQLAKGKQLFAEEKYDAAMDSFIDVLVNGSRAEVEEANKYINVIHSRIGGIQEPIEVGIDFKEGEPKRLNSDQDPAVLAEQLNAEATPIEQEVQEAGLPATAKADEAAIKAQQAQEVAAASQADLAKKQQEALQEQARQRALEMQNVPTEEEQEQAAQKAQAASNTTFTDLTTPAALKARQIYTSQKLENMKQAAIAKLEKTKGVRVYFRNGLPDALDIDSEVLFNGYKFRPEALPILDQVYTLMALTQGAGYIILPPGSYTDNITLSGIRQAMALNSFFVHKGLSSGKISYNMGLFDQEPPAKFANLEGVSIVFDFDADLPSALPDATAVSKLPLLSMAVVPVSNKIDPSAGEAFAIDFSVIETQNPLDTWVFQVVQHGANDSYYVVRQLEGFSPVYHQIVWNGRKGIIGPELACGEYTLVLTASDVQGGKRTIRRQIEVSCSAQAKAKAQKKNAVTQDTDKSAQLNYKTARLWTKPARTMKGAAVEEPEITEPEVVDPFATSSTEPVTSPNAVDYNEYNNAGNSAAQPAPETAPASAQGVSNPYDMPYEEYGN